MNHFVKLRKPQARKKKIKISQTKKKKKKTKNFNYTRHLDKSSNQMICSISGEPVKEPVVSPKSGAIFEKKHIINYISTSGTDPITDEPLTEDELITIKTTENSSTIAPPQLPTSSNTSIPALLSTFQNEWDALVLEMFTLRKQLNRAREELSIALYKQDAAINVAAKAIRERDEAKEALEMLTLSLSVRDEPMNDVIEDSKEDNLVNKMQELEKITNARDELFKVHKSQKVKFPFDVDTVVKLELTNKKDVFESEKVSQYSYNKNIKTIVGVCENSIIKQSFIDGVTSYFETAKPELAAISNNGVIAAVSSNIVTFSTTESSIPLTGEPKQIIPHLSLDIFIIITDKNWMVVNTKCALVTHNIVLSSAALHYDGEILAAQVDSEIQLFSIISGDQLGKFSVGYNNVVKIEFASNGYWLLVLSVEKSTSLIQIFDLRKGTEAHKLDFNDTVLNFIIDPTTSALLTFTKKMYTISRYTKKTKSWSQGEPENLDASFNPTHIELCTTVSDILDNNPIEVFTVDLKKNSLVYSEISK